MKKEIVITALVLLFGILLTNGVLGEISHCCEKTKVTNTGSGGAWCVDADVSECDTNFLAEPTACSSTSYCALGTCVNRESGECIINTPQRSCDVGFWSESSPADIPQCQLGCCFIGDQAAFVTQTKCKSFASLYSIDTHFQQNIQNEISCIASAFPDVQGACVYEREFETNCKMIARSECQGITDAEFHEGFLCTSEELATNCAVTDKTTCVEGKDEVFFTDSCGNVANVYDSSKIGKEGGQTVRVEGEGDYWETIQSPDCGSGANAGSASCGNCNYYEGSTCKKYERGEDPVNPNYGDNVCRNLGCEFDSDLDGTKENYLHGETWCADPTAAKGTNFLEIISGVLQTTRLNNLNTNLPGSRYSRMVCYNGEVTIEACADRRAEVCIQSERTVTGSDGTAQQFRSAVCRVNAWQDCQAQNSSSDCEDSSIRDCQWINGGNGEECVPLVAPGFDFWKPDNNPAGVCALATTTCETKASKKGGALGDIGIEGIETEWEQDGGEECFDINEDNGDFAYKDDWGKNQNQLCVSLGDCKGSVSKSPAVQKIKNYLGFLGN